MAEGDADVVEPLEEPPARVVVDVEGVLDGVLAWIDCEVDRVLDGGDHHIVVGRVRGLGVGDGATGPLVFYRGGYANLA